MFDARQARLLEAMGYRLLQRVGSSTVDGSAAPPVAGSGPRALPIDAMPPASPLASTTVGPPPTASTSDRATAGPGDRLWTALLQAAGLDPAGADAAGLRRAASGVAVEYLRDELWVDPLALRQRPREKRGLWKTLRALRRAELARTA